MHSELAEKPWPDGTPLQAEMRLTSKLIPLGHHLHASSPSEVQFAGATFGTIRVGRRHQHGGPRQKPERIIADRSYNRDSLRKPLAQRGIELIVHHHRNRRKPLPQDDPTRRRYKRLWSAGRSFAWFGNFRRPVVGYHLSLAVYRGHFDNACFRIV